MPPKRTGLPVSSRRTWRALADASDETLGALLFERALELRERRGELARWAELAGLPEGEVAASPFGARMVALGLEVGATTVHHEMRAPLRWAKRLRPPDETVDAHHGRWVGGALRAGKYQDFCQEDPFVSYHPEHSSKWAPHEFLHRAVGCFHRRDASGFERYLGARLNELLPVATWYGLEHALRLDREGPFDRHCEGTDRGADLANARWLTEPEPSLRRRARDAAPLVRWTIERVTAELDAIDREIAAYDVVPSVDAGLESFPNVRLDSSSDALAYEHAHRARLTDPSVSAVLEGLAASRFDTIPSLRRHVERTLDRLLFGSIRPSPARVRRRILANVLLDAHLRAATAGAPRVRAVFDEAARLAARVRRGELDVEAVRGHLASFVEVLVPHIGARTANNVVALGLARPFRALDSRLLRLGLRASLPATDALLTRKERDALLRHLIEAPPCRVLLPDRVARWFDERLESPRARVLSDLVDLEVRLARPSPTEPRRAWALAAIPSHGDCVVVRDRRFVVRRYATDVLSAHRGKLSSDEHACWAALGRVEGRAVLVELSEAVGRVLERMGEAPWPPRHFDDACGPGTVDELVRIGVLVALAR